MKAPSKKLLGRLAIGVLITGPLIWSLVQSQPRKTSHPCQPLTNRFLRVGITPWVGFSGGLIPNDGFHPNENSKFQSAGKHGIEFVVLDSFVSEEFDARAEALSGCADQDGHVDVLWSSVQSWAAEMPLLKKQGIDARAILEIARSTYAHIVVPEGASRDSKTLEHQTISVTRFTPAHWVALQEHYDNLVSEESAHAALQEQANGKVFGAALSEPYLHLAANGSAHAPLKLEKGDVTYILVARDEVIKQSPDLLQNLIRVWFDGNQDSRSRSPRKIEDILANHTVGSQSKESIREEITHVQLATREDNRKFFGLDDPPGEFDKQFSEANKYWSGKDLVDPIVDPSVARDNSLFLAITGAPDSCTPNGTPEFTIYFDTDRFNIERNADKLSLDQFATTLKKRPQAHACIYGYTDDTGEKEKNETLSNDRAQAVANYLLKSSGDKDKLKGRLSVIGMSQQAPAAKNETPTGRGDNRRVTVSIFEPRLHKIVTGRGGNRKREQ